MAVSSGQASAISFAPEPGSEYSLPSDIWSTAIITSTLSFNSATAFFVSSTGFVTL